MPFIGDLEAMLSDGNTHLIVGEIGNQIVATGYAQIRRQSAISSRTTWLFGLYAGFARIPWAGIESASYGAPYRVV